MALNLHLLRLFATVANSGGFSRAAEQLHLSQPAISKGVRDLERQLDTVLLDRGAGPVRPTETGAALLAHARRLFAAERAAEAELARFRMLHQGTLAIGASTTVATYVLPPLLGRFHRAHPAIELRLAIDNTGAIAARVLDRAVELAIVEGRVDEPGLAVTPWRTDELVLLAAPDHPVARATARTLRAAFAAAVLLTREPGSGTRDAARDALAARELHPGRTVEIGGSEAIKQLVAGGIGVTVLSAAAAADQIRLGRLVVAPGWRRGARRTLSRLVLDGVGLGDAATAFTAVLDGAPDRVEGLAARASKPT